MLEGLSDAQFAAILAAAWGVAASCLAFVLFGLDKALARRRLRRIAERELLFVAFIGGAAGAKLAQRRFRHKTQKQPFGFHLNVALAVNMVAALGFGVAFLGLIVT